MCDPANEVSPLRLLPLMKLATLEFCMRTTRQRTWVSCLAKSLVSLFPWDQVRFVPRRPPPPKRRVNPLVSLASPLEFDDHNSRVGSFEPTAPSMGFGSLSRRQSAASTYASVPSSLRSVLEVSHFLDGLLRHRPCEFISPRSHVWDFLSGCFPPSQQRLLVITLCPLVV